MPRRKDNAEPKTRSRPSKPKRKPTDKRKPKTTPPAEEEAVVSRSIMRRHSGRGGRGR